MPGKLQDLIGERETLFIDVRSKKEREHRALAGTEHMPLERIHELSYDKNTLIVTYCNSGIRAWKAAENLRNIGFKQVYCYSGTDLQLEKERQNLPATDAKKVQA